MSRVGRSPKALIPHSVHALIKHYSTKAIGRVSLAWRKGHNYGVADKFAWLMQVSLKISRFINYVVIDKKLSISRNLECVHLAGPF